MMFCPEIQNWCSPESPLSRRCCLSALFPELLSFPEEEVLQGLMAPVKKPSVLASAGFGMSFSGRTKSLFIELWNNWFTGTSTVDSGLEDDPITCLGLAWGIREWKDTAAIHWYKQQICETLKQNHSLEWAEFLSALIEGREDCGSAAHPEYNLFLKLFNGSHPASAVMQDYFITMRKCACPAYPNDIIRSILAVYMMDACIREYFSDPEKSAAALQARREETISEIRGKLDATLSHKAKWNYLLLNLGLLAGGASVSVGIFYFLEKHKWVIGWNDQLNALLFLVGSPAALFVNFLRTLYQSIRGKEWKWDFPVVKSKIENHLKKRWYKKLNL